MGKMYGLNKFDVINLVLTLLCTHRFVNESQLVQTLTVPSFFILKVSGIIRFDHVVEQA